MHLGIPYVDRILNVDIPSENLAFDVAPNNVAPAANMAGVLRRALANPIGAPTLGHLVHPGQRAIIIADDNTRVTPTKQILPVLLDELNRAGIPDSDIQVIIASGTHRPMTEAELEEKYGVPVMSRIKVLPHHYKDPANLVEYGVTKRGTRILVNKHVIAADFRIAVGNVIPHHPTGWSAGAKAVLPGVAGEETVAQMHFLGSRDPSLGRVDTEMRREMEDFAERIGLDFVVQVILNRDGLLVDAVAGHFVQAHRVAVDKSRQVYGVSIPCLADMTISSTAPVDLDFFQADKGIFAAELSTQVGGEIVLVSGCVEGVSGSHPELADYVGKMTNGEIWPLLHAHKVPDPLTGAEAIVINDLKQKMAITIASDGLSPELCERMGFRHVSPARLDDYVRSRLAASPGLRIGILRQSAEIVPILEQ
ncbi:MAG TPA: nickel-dependent lactate racemase [Anaerolineae bacterium]|nr:nickel-dependent lactate racemase [Anaerolineae bacterium]HPL27922.1 nickel-dependent lactate racemase [Anaerolineae bacterium]